MAQSRNTSASHIFRFSFWSLFRAGTGIVLCFSILAFIMGHMPHDFSAFISLLLSQSVLTGLMWWIMERIFTLRVTAEGLHGQTAMGTPCFLSWSEMERVRPAPLTRTLGIPFLYIHSFQKGRASLCIPLFLTRFPAFRQAVRDMASPLNPLRQSLENDGIAAERAPALNSIAG